VLDCTLKYKPRNPIGKILGRKSPSLCTIQYKPRKILIGKTWEKSSKENHKLVIGHGIGGKVIPAKMMQLAESQSLE
jgi:hypothetical protein